ncbi:hypothetical protein KI387_010649, partial [Taxus chinensis]
SVTKHSMGTKRKEGTRTLSHESYQRANKGGGTSILSPQPHPSPAEKITFREFYLLLINLLMHHALDLVRDRFLCSSKKPSNFSRNPIWQSKSLPFKMKANLFYLLPQFVIYYKIQHFKSTTGLIMREKPVLGKIRENMPREGCQLKAKKKMISIQVVTLIIFTGLYLAG